MDLDTTESISPQRLYPSVYTSTGGLSILGNEHILRKAFYDPILYVSLYTADADNAELEGNGYLRGFWPQEHKDINLSESQITNNRAIEIYISDSNSSQTARYLAIHDSETDGNQLIERVQIPATTPGRASRVKVPKGALVLEV